jgi:Spy/CpxP family protein refolding chaperone
MRTRVLVGICLLAMAVALGVTWAVNAVRASRSQDPLASLDLAPEQRRQIHALFQGFHPRLLELQRALDAKRARLSTLLVERAGVDDPAVQECLREIAALQAQLDREVANDLALLKPHLRPEQQRALFHYIEMRHPTVEKAR